MTPAAILTALQIAVGVCLCGYALFLIGKRLREIQWSFPALRPTDLQVLVELAAKFRDAGNEAAVAACQSVIDELLKPKKP